MKHDPIEDDPKYQAILAAAEAKAREELRARGVLEDLGFCHVLWQRKKEILRDEYGITWKTRSEMNPTVDFD